MLMRFTLAYLVLFFAKPKPLITDFRTELQFALLGLFGCTLYFLAENNALHYTYAANVSILVASAPILTALLLRLFRGDKSVGKHNFYGFLIAFAGIILVVCNGTVVLKLNPLGDLLSLLSALSWAIYGMLQVPLLRRFDAVFLTRRVMLWGFITALPVSLLTDAPPDFTPLLHNGTELFCILFLGDEHILIFLYLVADNILVQYAAANKAADGVEREQRVLLLQKYRCEHCQAEKEYRLMPSSFNAVAL